MSRRWQAIVPLLRIAAVLLCFELSGAAHATMDLLTSIGLATEQTDCDDGDDDRCPPSCPNCHCAGCGAKTLPAARASTEILELGQPIRHFIPTTSDRAPGQPDLPSVYRPPRGHVRFT